MAKARDRVPAEAKLRRFRTLPASIPVIALVREDRRIEPYQSVRTYADFYNDRLYKTADARSSELTDPPAAVMLAYLEHWLVKPQWELLGLRAETDGSGHFSPRTLTLAAHASVLSANETARRLGLPMFFVGEGEVAQSLGLSSLSFPLAISAELVALLERTRTSIGFSIKFGSPPKHGRPLFVELGARIDDLLWCMRRQATRRRLWYSATGTAEFLERLFLWSRGVVFSGLYHVVQSIANEKVVLENSGEVQDD